VKARIRELIVNSMEQPEVPHLTPELSAQIFQDIQDRKLYTYRQAAEMIGCDPETIRVHARGFPVIKRTKPHRIPACVLNLIVRMKLIAA
jgi:hypothetical protein